MKIGYIRSSSITQNNEYQFKAMEHLNIERYFVDKVSGRTNNRAEFNNLMDFIREGDELYIYDLSRLSRSLKDVLNIIDTLKNKNIKIISIKENLDTSTPNGILMISMIGAINEFVITTQREKQMEGILIAKSKGKFKGRKKIEYPKNWDKVMTMWRNREITSTMAMKLTDLKKSTFYKFLKEDNQKRINERLNN